MKQRKKNVKNEKMTKKKMKRSTSRYEKWYKETWNGIYTLYTAPHTVRAPSSSSHMYTVFLLFFTIFLFTCLFHISLSSNTLFDNIFFFRFVCLFMFALFWMPTPNENTVKKIVVYMLNGHPMKTIEKLQCFKWY